MTAVLGLTLMLPAGAVPSPAQAGAPTAPKAYVGVFNDNVVAVIDTGTNRVLTTISTGIPDGGTLFHVMNAYLDAPPNESAIRPRRSDSIRRRLQSLQRLGELRHRPRSV